MKIVVIGGTGLIGTKLVVRLREQGHEAVPASPNTGVNTLTGEGLSQALEGAAVVIDVSNSPSFDEDVAMKFFSSATANVLAAEVVARVRHHVALSVVGAERLVEMGYFRAKLEQERLIRESRVPYTIVRATQFYEFLKAIAAAGTDGNAVRVPPVLFQPMAADDIASAVGSIAARPPANRTIEIAGPAPIRLDAFIRRGLGARKDPRNVITDPRARYFGAQVGERTLLPENDARLGETSFEQWLALPWRDGALADPEARLRSSETERNQK